MVFKKYAEFYDNLYKNRKYEEETEFVHKLIKKHKPKAKTILDLGCGTGRHDALLVKKGYKVLGIDKSLHMVSLAKKNNPDLRFKTSDIKSFKSNEKFDVIISLFHVLSYHNFNKDVRGFFNTIKKHLKKDGICIFDFWYGPAVLTQKPERRVKVIETRDTVFKRIATPTLKENENLVVIDYSLVLRGERQKVSESHIMRYFFLPELAEFMSEFKLKTVTKKEWLTNNKPSTKSWGVYLVGKN